MPSRSPTVRTPSATTTLPKISPIKFIERATPFDDLNFIFELKYDGYRAVAYIENGTVKLVSRRAIPYTKFDSLCTGIANTVKVRNAILDGEIVCLDETGKPRFDWLLHRRCEPCFVAFDLMWLNGRDYRTKPLLERKKLLRQVVRSNSPWVLYADFVIERGISLFQAASQRDLEGIVGKQKDAAYTESVRWVKIKNPGYTQAIGRGEGFRRGRGR